MKPLFTAADILLPDFSAIDAEKYACIACDQFTSEPEYWEEVEALVKDAPSLYRIILPECYLESEGEEAQDARISRIHEAMRAYKKSLLSCHKDSMIYLERQDTAGKIRRGLVGKIDLEGYCYEKGSKSPVRATEGTVLSRIPPRLRVRRGAPLEAPHVMLLIDDPENTLFSTVEKGEKTPAYDFSLMQGGGAVKGYFLSPALISEVEAFLSEMEKTAALPYAVGDGNHSLATAKAYYEEIKAALGEERAKKHPARYALVELVNIHDESLEFEPIYRLLRGIDKSTLIDEFDAFYRENTEKGNQRFTLLYNRFGRVYEEGRIMEHIAHSLTVGTLQIFFDKLLEKYPNASLDYIHGEDSLRALSLRADSFGFLFDGMEKKELFPSVAKDGSLPRKTFSMGTSRDKRYYLECRSIEEAEC